MKRLFWITGKGGVGKTQFALALTAHLAKQKDNVFYISAENTPPLDDLKQHKIPFLTLPPKHSTELYIEKKFHSKLVAKAITKTPFFDSMFQILPSLAYLMFLGHLVYLLERDPSLTLVIDLPASGHAQALIESSFIFQKIFKSGAIFQDINNMHNFLYQNSNTEIIILALPAAMAIEEAIELKTAFLEHNIPNIAIYLNSVLTHICNPEECSTGNLKIKLQQETEVIKQFKQHINATIPFIYSSDKFFNNLVAEVAKQWS